jgi:predicted MPP superfamily phosphohydrolase
MKILARSAALLVALALLFLGVGLWNATRPPVVVKVTHKLAGLPPGTRLRVLVMSDLHFGHPDMGTGRMLGIMRSANEQKPDLILLAGDYIGGKIIDWPRVWLEQALPPLAALQAPMGVYAVMGNHDQPHWTPRIMARQKRPVLLDDEWVDLGPLLLVGLDSTAHGSNLAKALAGAPEGKPRLLLMHEGDRFAFANPPGRPDVLALAGHTHGGQIILPLIGNLADRLLGRALCLRGACRINGWPLHVTSGVGTSWLPLRYGVAPEMVLLTLVPA